MIERLADDPAIVPPIFPFECANALLSAERKHRISKEDADRQLANLLRLPILVLSPDPAHVVASLAIGREYGLSVYDAAYLQVARLMEVPLVTLDQQLRDAADRAGVRSFGA